MAPDSEDLTKEQLIRRVSARTKDDLAAALAARLTKDDLVSLLGSRLKKEDLAKLADEEPSRQRERTSGSGQEEGDEQPDRRRSDENTELDWSSELDWAKPPAPTPAPVLF